ncbi:hypothetical protein [Neobacillus sp. 19]|uniref:hypothetical protein n=1 Tax=Neobacillus sp. 19 TaxID=3394458 RepID=UPI003C2FACCF
MSDSNIVGFWAGLNFMYIKKGSRKIGSPLALLTDLLRCLFDESKKFSIGAGGFPLGT